MKRKILILLLALSLLSGCGAAPAQPETPEDLPAVEVQTVPAPAIHYEVELNTVENTAESEDGEVLATYRAQIPTMKAVLEDGTVLEQAASQKQESALAVVQTFNGEFESWTAEEFFQQLVSDAQAEADYCKANGLTPIGNYAMDLACTVYETDRIVSVSGLLYSFTGGAHPNTWLMGWNFDLESGSFFDGEMLAAEASGLQETVAQELMRQAEEIARSNDMLPEEMFHQGYEGTIAKWTNYPISFDEEGMKVSFSPYELAPYAAGAQEFHLSYEWLEPLLGQHGRALLGLEAAEMP